MIQGLTDRRQAVITPDRTRIEAALAYVEESLERSRSAEIDRPDQNGAFPGSRLHGLLRGESLLVVPDTNVLLSDIGHFFRTGMRTVLASAANNGAIRLFCAQHVHEEVYRHSEERAPKYGATRSEYLALWAREYLPLMRTIDEGDLPAELLAPAASSRLQRFGLVDR
jgi:hypothetical protein